MKSVGPFAIGIGIAIAIDGSLNRLFDSDPDSDPDSD